MRIVLYIGEGVSGRHLLRLTHRFSFPLKRVKASFFYEPNWEQSIDLVVVPGGRDLLYHEKLKGEPCRRIRSFVEQGGSYLGICAGAYFASSTILFDEGGPLEVVDERELKFFPGEAVGPIYKDPPFSYQSESGAQLVPILIERQTYLVYFNGGCSFAGANQQSTVEVLARYSGLPHEPAAIIHCSVGKGQALLSGVHPENPQSDPLIWQLIEKKILT